MVARPTWQGRLKLSLVSCPVSLFTATTSANDVRFHLINPETNNRIRMVPTDPDTGPVERSDLVRGYEVKKDEYVLFDDADFDKVKLESTKAISIDRFVDEKDIDRLYWDTPHYMVPDKDGAEAFSVIREAMKKAGKVALGCLVLRGKERQVALEVRDKGIVAYTLRAQDEGYDAFLIATIPVPRRGARRGRLLRRHPDGQGRQGHDRDRPQDHRPEGSRLRSRRVQGRL